MGTLRFGDGAEDSPAMSTTGASSRWTSRTGATPIRRGLGLERRLVEPAWRHGIWPNRRSAPCPHRCGLATSAPIATPIRCTRSPTSGRDTSRAEPSSPDLGAAQPWSVRERLAIESFMDELADHAGIDPVELRLNSLDDERARAVIQTVADEAGWAPSDRRTAGEVSASASTRTSRRISPW